MQQNGSNTPAFTVEFRGLKVQCDDVNHVVEAVKALAPLEYGDRIEREVPVPQNDATLDIPGASPLATATYDLFRAEPRWRRPVEIVRELRKRRITGAKYTTVYAVLRYGDFVKREGRWNVADAQHASV